MNREILFRAWDKKYNDWVNKVSKPDFVRHFADQLYFEDEEYPFSDRLWLDGIENLLNDYGERLIIEQYTGVDDSRSKKIFENDFLLVSQCGDRSIHVVRWGGREYPAYYLEPELRGDVNCFSEIEHAGDIKTRVIGNIHENPELLKQTRGNVGYDRNY